MFYNYKSIIPVRDKYFPNCKVPLLRRFDFPAPSIFSTDHYTCRLLVEIEPVLVVYCQDYQAHLRALWHCFRVSQGGVLVRGTLNRFAYTTKRKN